MRSQLAVILMLSVVNLGAQAPAKKAAPKTAAPAAAASPMAKILQMVEMKLPEAAVLKAIQSAGNLNPSADDYLKLKQLGASDAIIAAVSGAPVPAAPTAAAPAVAATAKMADYNTDLSTLSCVRPTGSPKRVLAIDEFDYGTVRNTAAAIFGTQVDLGKGMLALMTKRLAEDGQYRIVERKNLQKVLSEQDLGASNRVRQGTQAKIGRVQGADAILMGTVTVFGQDTRNNRVNTGAITRGKVGGILGNVNVGKRSDKAIVEVSYRLVDAETSEVIAVGEARGESKRESSGVGLAGYAGGHGGGVAVDMTSANFLETIIGEATVDCLNKLAAIANSKAGSIQPKANEVEARIAEVAGKKIYLNAGSNEGIQQCDRFEVARVIKEIKDPSTGEVLDLQTEKVGELVVTEVREKIAIAVFNGTAEPKVGYVAKKL